MRHEDAANAVAALMAKVDVPAGDAAKIAALARRRTARRRYAIVSLAAIMIGAFVTVHLTTTHTTRHVASRPTTITTTPPTVPAVPGGIVGCPTQPVTTAPPGDPPAGLVAAARRDVSVHSLFTGATIGSVYRLGLPDAGAFSGAFVDNVTSCGHAAIAGSWVVELHHPAAAQLSAVVLAHYANGWHVFGSYP